jgi:hypothetical protein
MSDTNLEEAQQLFKQAEPAPTISEYQREQIRLRASYERLKQQRREREAVANGSDSRGQAARCFDRSVTVASPRAATPN